MKVTNKMNMIFKPYLIIILLLCTSEIFSQRDTCINPIQKYEIDSQHLNEKREYWVSLPMNYDTSKTYPVIYLFDAEWRFDLIRTISYDMAGNKKIPHHIIVGIPHIDWKRKRGQDLTFSQSRNEYNEEKVDSTVYNNSNSGGGQNFYNYLNNELVTTVDHDYPTNGNNILIGHSYGGYFNSYILSKNHKFKSFQIYDPSIWYSNGEAILESKNNLQDDVSMDVFITYQPIPKFHSDKIEELIETLSDYKNINLDHKVYNDESHNSLFLISFNDGMNSLYKTWNEK